MCLEKQMGCKTTAGEHKRWEGLGGGDLVNRCRDEGTRRKPSEGETGRRKQTIGLKDQDHMALAARTVSS